MNHSSVKHGLMFDSGVVHIVVAGYIVAHYCLWFDRGVVHIVVAGYIVAHYCLMFDRGSNGKQYKQPQQYEPLLC
jgi:hypothetical protein